MKNILYSFLGTSLDVPRKKKQRWSYWRPSVALALQDDIHFDEYHIWYDTRFQPLFETVRADILECSPGTEVFGEVLDLRDPWDFEEVYSRLYDFSRALDPQPEEHRYYIHITTGTHVAQICLFLLNESRHLPGLLIQTSPDRENPACGNYTLIDLDLSRYDLLAKRFAMERQDDLAFLKSGIETRNESFNRLIETIERVAVRSREPILLTGPTGAGKSRLAKNIYELKKLNRQVTGKFVDVNCATLRGDQAMAALFGHTRGAFTGAVKDRPGLLKTADNGVLFLDEVGELGLDEQAMLLRAIEEQVFLPLGSDQEVGSQFLLICGTNRDLETAVASGRFREDLYARINLWRFRLPGLAERREDIEPNIEYELEEYSRLNGQRISFNKEAWREFLEFAGRHDWRGNFRELNATITRMATLAPGGRIDLATVKAETEQYHPVVQQDQDDSLKSLLGDDYQQRYDLFELSQLREVLKVCAECKTQSEAGRKLFAVSRLAKRSTNDADRLGRYLANFGIKFADLQK
ncbi:MAG: sigma 54-interacting transcriptional regulator [Lentisphaerae bacterium]|jgi:transcriptional regulatory protein RtcR|nr:sigma 54-interacting transcriptional regulator [Lentisphaerota bacterium]